MPKRSKEDADGTTEETVPVRRSERRKKMDDERNVPEPKAKKATPKKAAEKPGKAKKGGKAKKEDKPEEEPAENGETKTEEETEAAEPAAAVKE